MSFLDAAKTLECSRTFVCSTLFYSSNKLIFLLLIELTLTCSRLSSSSIDPFWEALFSLALMPDPKLSTDFIEVL